MARSSRSSRSSSRGAASVAANRAATSHRGRGAASLDELPTQPVETSLSTAQLERRDSGILLLLDGTESSWIDLRDPGHLDFEYQQHMNAVVECLWEEPAPLSAVHLGGAGCALARAWEARRAGSTQLAVEIDELLASYVRQWFDLPRSPRLRIRVGDAAVVAPTLKPASWDVVVRDVFACGAVPASCTSEDFHRSCAQALSAGGVYLLNMPSMPREDAARELALLRRLFPGVLVIADAAVVRGKRRGNLIVSARREPWGPDEVDRIERAVRRLPLPARTFQASDPALPQL